MKISTFFKLFLAVFAITCGCLIWQTGIFCRGGCPTKGSIISLAATAEEPNAAQPQQKQTEQSQMTAAQPPLELSAISAKEQKVVLGKVYDKCVRMTEPDKYKFEVELTSLGAAVRTAQLSEFSDLDPKNPKPLRIINPVTNDKPVYSLACESLYVARKDQPFGDLAFPLDKLQWRFIEPLEADRAVFVAELGNIEDKDGRRQLAEPMLRITRTYQVQPASYDLTCDTKIENLTTEPLKAQMLIAGPAGISHEGTQRDMLKVLAAYRTEKGEVVSRKTDTNSMKKAVEKSKPENLKIEAPDKQSVFLWAALTNKYFTAILYPSTDASKSMIGFETCRYFPEKPGVRRSENASFALKTATFELTPKKTPEASVSLVMNLYLGPKEKKVFEDNPVYKKLAFFQTMDFSSCCCPQQLISPLAFGIIWLMNAMYHWMGPLGNYGIVIMFFVFLIRLALHPLTKSGQVQMMKMQKMSPKIQEIQRKYANNKAEIQKQTMLLLYKEGGVSQMMFMVPMFLQMPIWIALWTAVSISIDLRGQAFLPFWITDLSGPDALIRFTPFAIPFVGWEISSLNLLPLLMGVVMYLQTKLTPQAQTAPASPEMAQQQKLMSVMMVAMFPIMLYNGPSGVNLYIMSSIAAGVVEQYVIRKHLREKQEQEEETLVPTTAKLGKVKKKKPKPFFKFDR